MSHDIADSFQPLLQHCISDGIETDRCDVEPASNFVGKQIVADVKRTRFRIGDDENQWRFAVAGVFSAKIEKVKEDDKSQFSFSV